MSHPGSLLTRFRRRLTAWAEPWPQLREAWCQDCELNNGRTMAFRVAAIRGHVLLHAEKGTRKPVRVKVNNPAGGVL